MALVTARLPTSSLQPVYGQLYARRGMLEYVGRGIGPGYSAKYGAAVYKINRSRYHRLQCIPSLSVYALDGGADV